MTTLRIALSGGKSTIPTFNAPPPPALLLSYVYRDLYLDAQSRLPIVYRDWALDSGAYTAHTMGQAINLDEYIEFCLAQTASDPTLVEVFALDVINDPEASLRNTERMWAAGVRAIPTFHSGEPWEVLTHIAARYPKIAIGGAVGMDGASKMKWTEQVFARVYPKKIHGLGYGAQQHLFAAPFHSADATNWHYAVRFGYWVGFSDPFRQAGRRDFTVRGAPALRMEIAWHLRLERYLKDYWASEMLKLDALPDPTL